MIRTSKKVKQELEKIQEEGEFKSIDAVLRYLLDASIRISGGIFLGSNNRNGKEPIDVHNVRHSYENNFFELSIEGEKIIELYQCLYCGNISLPEKTKEPVVIPNCGCGHGMAKITIKVEP